MEKEILGQDRLLHSDVFLLYGSGFYMEKRPEILQTIAVRFWQDKNVHFADLSTLPGITIKEFSLEKF